MMERRRALTIPFTVQKDNMMEDPLKIPMKCLPSECGNLGQVSWTAIAGCPNRPRNARHKNGSSALHDSRAAMIALEMTRRKPLLVLTDVLKTELGRAHMERIKSSAWSGRRLRASLRQESSHSTKEPPAPTNTPASARGTRSSRSKSGTLKSNQKTTEPTPQRSKSTRRVQNTDDKSEKEESQDSEDVITGEDEDKEDTFAEVVDCGLSLSWERSEDTEACDKFTPDCIKERLIDVKRDSPQSLKRERKDSPCNGACKSKRQCKVVLSRTEEKEENCAPSPAQSPLKSPLKSSLKSPRKSSVQSSPKSPGKSPVQSPAESPKQSPTPSPAASPEAAGQEENDEHFALDSLDRCIVKFTIGGDDKTPTLVPFIGPSLEDDDIMSNLEKRLSLTQESSSQTRPVDPIVLSSDEEEADADKRATRAQVAAEDTSAKGDVSPVAHMEIIPAEFALPPLDPFVLNDDVAGTTLAFSTLYCGGSKGKANGDFMVTTDQVIIPLKDLSEQRGAVLSFSVRELRKYSVWEESELMDRGLWFVCEGPGPCTVLLLCVSEAAAAVLHSILSELDSDDDETTDIDKRASPFIFLCLKEPLLGMEGALLRSVLEIECIKNMEDTPVLSMDESLDAIRESGLDLDSLLMHNAATADVKPTDDQENSLSDTDEVPTTHIWTESNFQKEPEPEPEPEKPLPEEPEAQLEPQEEEKEREEEPPKRAESLRKVTGHAYTLRHQKIKGGSYSVTVCTPGATWVKYKYQGVARRLIQFPPPPLKGGITVTLEDLQCLDSGQYLNDVIIDFYLKYLLHDESGAVVERCHVFSSFFYKQLTRRDNASEGGSSDSCQRQRRHQRVKNWTRHVDIFQKDFLFVPVNQEAHWYLVVICFPGLTEPKLESWTARSEDEGQQCRRSEANEESSQAPSCSHNINVETGETSLKRLSMDTPLPPVSCTEQTCHRMNICKRPCILLMDSLKISLHERVVKLLREYLQSEWEVRRGSFRDFGPDQMKSSNCQVPLQDNSSDCGLYLLQYVECFLKDPVAHFDLPLQLKQWFPRQQVRRKREQIRDLILNLYRHQQLDNKAAKQPPS